jgi:hypothetical protein
MEKLKLDAFTNLDVLADVDEAAVANILKSGSVVPKQFMQVLSDRNINLEDMPIDVYRKHVVGVFIAEHIE